MAGAALGLVSSCAALGGRVPLLVDRRNEARVAALLLAVLVIVPAIALLPGLHDLVAAEGAVGGLEAVLATVFGDGVQHLRNIAHRALRELVVVESVSRGGRREHDVVALPARGKFCYMFYE